MQTTTHTFEETKQAGRAFAKTLTESAIICLTGDLGAGKTTFVKGLAEGLGITEEMTSPTFTLMNVHPIRSSDHSALTTLVHIDTYRLEDHHELIDIGIEDYLGQPGVVTLIEWPDKIKELLKDKKMTNVTIDHLGGDSRRITID